MMNARLDAALAPAALALATVIATVIANAPAANAQATNLNVGFGSGPLGWSINGQNQVTPAGGNPGANLPWNDPIDTFGLAVRNSVSPAFLGDYTLKGPVRLGLDVEVDYINFFFSPVPRELIVILYDDDPFGLAAPAAVWTTIGTLDGNGQPWTTYSAEVTDPLSTALPTGWNGFGAEDPVTFEPILPPGRNWANVLRGVDRIEFTTFVPGFFFGSTNFDLQVDNVQIRARPAATWTNLGQSLDGVNGAPFLTANGDLSGGSVNTLILSNAAPGSFGALAWSGSSSPVPFAGGTLVPFPFNDPIYVNTNADGGAFLPFVMPLGVPPGAPIYAQFAVLDFAAVQDISLSNAAVGMAP